MSGNTDIQRVEKTVASMQRRIRSLDALLEEQIRTLELEKHLYHPRGFVLNRRGLLALQVATVLAAILAFWTGFVAGTHRVFL